MWSPSLWFAQGSHVVAFWVGSSHKSSGSGLNSFCGHDELQGQNSSQIYKFYGYIIVTITSPEQRQKEYHSTSTNTCTAGKTLRWYSIWHEQLEAGIFNARYTKNTKWNLVAWVKIILPQQDRVLPRQAVVHIGQGKFDWWDHPDVPTINHNRIKPSPSSITK